MRNYLILFLFNSLYSNGSPQIGDHRLFHNFLSANDIYAFSMRICELATLEIVDRLKS